ncbi:MAG: copper resistance system multicopper oxidase [Alphaproteobacteria bacterium]|nr:copper resistance system multicopper oxidase [Alphaproteobacteria bacterium]
MMPFRFLFAALLLTAALLGVPSAWAGRYDLTVETATVDVGGRTARKMTINGGVPGPTLHLKEGEDATITVTNRTDAVTSVHWHGILLPGMMDGAPGFNGFMGIKPGESFTYTFHIRQSGTYWYHSHSGTQDQSVLGAIVIDPKTPAPAPADRDYVVLLGDATAEDSDQVLRNLKADSGYYNHAQRTLGDFLRDADKDGLGAALKDRGDWGEMRMDPTDIADVTGYSFLVNGRAPAANATFLFRKGERVRLRLINGSAMTLFDVRVPGLKLTVVAADGQDVVPVTVDQIRMGVAERYDVIVEPAEDVAYTLFAESIDRTGYARASLAPRDGMEGPIPAMSPRAILAMSDMGMSAMAGMDHGAMGHDMAGMDMPVMGPFGTTMPGPDHAAMGHAMPGGEGTDGSGRPKGWAGGVPDGLTRLDYGQLAALHPSADTAAPSRTITVRLTGNMERYLWSLNDRKFGDAEPIKVRYGERVRLSFVNETMMAHPIHLHGQFFQLENGRTNDKPLKDTVIVPPGKTVSAVLTAREVGAWPLHCHLLYHMVAGMMTRFVVEPPGSADVTPDAGTITMSPHDMEGHGMGMDHGDGK